MYSPLALMVLKRFCNVENYYLEHYTYSSFAEGKDYYLGIYTLL